MLHPEAGTARRNALATTTEPISLLTVSRCPLPHRPTFPQLLPCFTASSGIPSLRSAQHFGISRQHVSVERGRSAQRETRCHCVVHSLRATFAMDASAASIPLAGFNVTLDGASAAPVEYGRVVLVGVVISDKAVLRTTQALLTECVLSAAKTGDEYLLVGDAGKSVPIEAVKFDAADRDSFQSLGDAIDATCVITPKCLLPARIVDCIGQAVVLLQNGGIPRLDVVIVSDIDGAAQCPRNFSTALSSLSSAVGLTPFSLSIVALCDIPHSTVSVLSTIAETSGCAVFGGAEHADFVEGFNRVKETLDITAPSDSVVCYFIFIALSTHDLQCGDCMLPRVFVQAEECPTKIVKCSPPTVVVGVGGLLSLGVEVSGHPFPSFQWSFNGTPILGAVASRYIVRHASRDVAGQYSCTIVNDKGTVVSKPITVSVSEGVLGVAISTETNVSDGVRAGSSLALSATVSQARTSMHLQWLLDGRPIAYANAQRYIIPVVAEDTCGAYSCRVTIGLSCVTSSPLEVRLAPEPPLIDWHTNSKHVNLYKPEVLKVHALGIPSVNYQWYFNDEPVYGATQPELAFTRVEAENCGRYYCKVTWLL